MSDIIIFMRTGPTNFACKIHQQMIVCSENWGSLGGINKSETVNFQMVTGREKLSLLSYSPFLFHSPLHCSFPMLASFASYRHIPPTPPRSFTFGWEPFTSLINTYLKKYFDNDFIMNQHYLMVNILYLYNSIRLVSNVSKHVFEYPIKGELT